MDPIHLHRTKQGPLTKPLLPGTVLIFHFQSLLDRNNIYIPGMILLIKPSIEFGTPDCDNGWAILKGGTAQSIGCYTTKEAAEEALSALKNEQIDIAGDDVRTSKTPEEFAENHVPLMNKSMDAKSIWDGVFVPADKGQMATEFNAQDQDARYYFPSKAIYENDGKPSVGYGNRSSNQSIPEGNYTPDRTT